jgi:hypothetical protein
LPLRGATPVSGQRLDVTWAFGRVEDVVAGRVVIVVVGSAAL